MQGAEHGFRIHVVEAILRVLSEVDTRCECVFHEALAQMIRSEGTVDRGQHAAQKGMAVPVLLQAQGGIVGKGLGDHLAFLTLLHLIDGLAGCDALH